MKPLTHDVIMTHSRPVPLIQELHAAHKVRQGRWWPLHVNGVVADDSIEHVTTPIAKHTSATARAVCVGCQHDAHMILWFRSLGMNRGYPQIRAIIEASCSYYGVSYEDMLSPRRFKTLVRPRQVAMYLAKALTVRSFPEIGRRFGGRDHTTVLHSASKIQALLKTDAELAEQVRAIRESIGMVETRG